ncbi:MAG: sulfite exporter TauE/SafE family protein [Candidatus Puniceispirillaceae bacterium]|jgi:uncharacterized membrane protein YfcA
MLIDVMDPTLLIGIMLALGAAAMTAYAGFGGALVMVPLFTFLIGPVQAVAVMAICSVVALVHVVPGLIRNIRWSEVVPLFFGLLISASVGSHFLVVADAETIRLGMGIFILISAAVLILDFKYSGPRGILPSMTVGAVTGGIMGGFGVPAGPVMVVYYLAAPEPAQVQRANIMFSVWLLLTVMLINLLARDAIETTTFLRSIFIAPASILGAMLGQYLFRRAPVSWFRKCAHWLLIAIGVSLLVVAMS